MGIDSHLEQCLKWPLEEVQFLVLPPWLHYSTSEAAIWTRSKEKHGHNMSEVKQFLLKGTYSSFHFN